MQLIIASLLIAIHSVLGIMDLTHMTAQLTDFQWGSMHVTTALAILYLLKGK